MPEAQSVLVTTGAWLTRFSAIRWLGRRFMLARRAAYAGLERAGWHITRNHYYSPVPDVGRLPTAMWERVSELPGLDLRVEAQLELLGELEAYRAEYEALPDEPTGDPHQFHVRNMAFGPVDAGVLYALLRRLGPRRVVEVGTGYSTLLAAQALALNAADGRPGRHWAIDPWPFQWVGGSFPAGVEPIAKPVQEVPLSTFEALEEGDVLFLDSSHVAKAGSDVVFEILEVLPRLRPGVVVHVHDIFLPREYDRGWVEGHHRFWNEQYMLQAFLAFNRSFEVLWTANLHHHERPERLGEAFPAYRNALPDVYPVSFWMRRTA
jgi:predicted O-methyltransferase YrrM